MLYENRINNSIKINEESKGNMFKNKNEEMIRKLTEQTSKEYLKKNKLPDIRKIANGSIVKGQVINSIVSRNVVIEEGAVVKNCILFTKTYVGKDANLEYVVADKNVEVKQVKKIKGEKQEIIFIKQGSKI
jgi:glucose-1-phosphate adenylyltransferase